MILSLQFLLAFLMGALLSRWHGGGFFRAPKWLKNFCWAFPIATTCSSLYLNFYCPLLSAVFIFVLAASWTTKTTGKGGSQDLAYSPEEPGNGRDIEVLEHLIYWLYDKMPRYWYDVLGLAVNGLVAAAAPAIIIGYINPTAGAFMLLGGLAVPAGYMIGWKIFPNHKGKGANDFNEATELGESISGGIYYLILFLACEIASELITAVI